MTLFTTKDFPCTGPFFRFHVLFISCTLTLSPSLSLLFSRTHKHTGSLYFPLFSQPATLFAGFYYGPCSPPKTATQFLHPVFSCTIRPAARYRNPYVFSHCFKRTLNEAPHTYTTNTHTICTITHRNTAKHTHQNQ